MAGACEMALVALAVTEWYDGNASRRLQVDRDNWKTC